MSLVPLRCCIKGSCFFAFLFKPVVKLLVQLTHFIRRFHRVPVHKPIPERTLKNQAEYPSHKRHGQQTKRLHFLWGKPDLPGRDHIEVIPDLLCSFSHEYGISSRMLGIRRFIIRICNRHNHCQMTQLPGMHVRYDLIRYLRPVKNTGKLFFSSVRLSEGRRLDNPRCQGRIQYVSVKAAACTGEGRDDPSRPANSPTCHRSPGN